MKVGDITSEALYSGGVLVYSSGATVTRYGRYFTAQPILSRNVREYEAAGAGLISGGVVAVFSSSGAITAIDYQPAISGGYAVASGIRPFNPASAMSRYENQKKGFLLTVSGGAVFLPLNAKAWIEKTHFDYMPTSMTSGSVVSGGVGSFSVYSSSTLINNDNVSATTVFSNSLNVDCETNKVHFYHKSTFYSSGTLTYNEFADYDILSCGSGGCANIEKRGGFLRDDNHPNGKAYCHVIYDAGWDAIGTAFISVGIRSQTISGSRFNENWGVTGGLFCDVSLVQGGYKLNGREHIVGSGETAYKYGISGNAYYRTSTLQDGSILSYDGSNYYINPAGETPTAKLLYETAEIVTSTTYNQFFFESKYSFSGATVHIFDE